MMNNFEASLNFVLNSEGGFVDDPQDSGGATNEGVTQHQYDLWRIAHGLQTRSVKNISDDEVEGFYRSWYWDKVHGDALPAGVDYCVFDCAVNSGPFHAAQWLQQAVGVANDGQIGAMTLAAVNADLPRNLIESIGSTRLAFMGTLHNWPHFGQGWTNRVNEVRDNAIGMLA